METKANYVVVGIFTILAVLAGFGFIYWAAAIDSRGETATLRVRIPGSANGLGRGSAVLFNGVKVGDVVRVFIDVQNPSVAIADTEVDRLTPITTSTEADIGIAGLTGQANIELSGGNLAEPKLLDVAEAEGRVAEITADPSAVTNLLKYAQDIFERADNVLGQLEGFTSEVRGPLGKTVANAQTFSEALARNADGIDKFLTSVGSLSEELAGVSGKLDGTLKAAEDLLTAVDREKVANVVTNVETFTQRLTETSADFDRIIGGVDTAVASLNQFAASSNQTLARVDQAIQGIDPALVRSTLDNINQASQTARTAAEDVAKLTGSLSGRSEDIDQAITEARQLAERLNQASLRIDGMLARVDTLLDPAAPDSVVADAKQTLAAYREVATTATARLDETMAKVDALLDPAKPDGLIGEARQTLAAYRRVAENVNTRVDGILLKAENLLGSGEAEGVIVQASDTLKSYKQVADTLNSRLGGILGKVDNLVGSKEVQGLVTDASQTLKAFRQVADTLNARAGSITEGLARFTGQGLRDVEALVRDGRRSISRIEQAVTDFERNPQRVLTGGEGTVRQYDGRARR